ncbi:MAG: GNAT family N-acetyltransferase [Solirubrobacteraceae bacterium]
MTLPILTERLAMRAYQPGDLDQLHAVLYGDPAAMALLGGARDRAGTRASIERSMVQQELSGYSFWPVFERESGLLIGEAGLCPLTPGGMDIALGYAFGRDFWDRGYATEVGRSILSEAFATLGLQRVVAITREANTRSRKVLGKLGFRASGRRHIWGAEQLYFVLNRVGYKSATQPDSAACRPATVPSRSGTPI